MILSNKKGCSAMDDSFVIVIEDGYKVLGLAYFELFVYTDDMIELVNKVIDAFPNGPIPQNHYEKYELAIDLLEATGARMLEYELNNWENMGFVDKNKKQIPKRKRTAKSDYDSRPSGLIYVTRSQVKNSQYYIGTVVWIDISMRKIDLNVRLVDKEEIQKENALDEYAEIFDDPEYLPLLDVTESELHTLSFDRFKVLGNQILNISNEYYSYARLKDGKYISFSYDHWKLPYIREGFVEGYMLTAIGMMLYAESSDEFIKLMATRSNRSHRFARKMYSAYQGMRIDCFELIKVLKECGCDDDRIKDVLVNHLDIDRPSAELMIENADKHSKKIAASKYIYARKKARELIAQGLTEREVVNMVSGLFRIPSDEVKEMLVTLDSCIC